jgi:hypothetical protein
MKSGTKILLLGEKTDATCPEKTPSFVKMGVDLKMECLAMSSPNIHNAILGSDNSPLVDGLI